MLLEINAPQKRRARKRLLGILQEDEKIMESDN